MCETKVSVGTSRTLGIVELVHTGKKSGPYWPITRWPPTADFKVAQLATVRWPLLVFGLRVGYRCRLMQLSLCLSTVDVLVTKVAAFLALFLFSVERVNKFHYNC